MSDLKGRKRRLLAIAGLVLLTTFLAIPSARAFEGRSGDVVIIEADEVVDDDLYVGASEFTLDGVVKGDLVVAGSTIKINGTVEGDLWAAGQSIVINGVVEDDVRAAGYAVLIGGEAAGDAIVAGFSLENESRSSIGGDLIFRGAQTLMLGEVMGNADLAGSAVKIAGSIGKDAKVDVSEAEPGEGVPQWLSFFPTLPTVPSAPVGLTIGEEASIGGNLDYAARGEAEIPAGVVAGETTFTQSAEAEAEEEAKATPLALFAGRWFVRQMRRLTTLLLIGALMMWLIPDWTRKVAGIVQDEPLPSLGWGVVSIVAFAVVMFALAVATVLLAIIFGVVTLGELAGRFAILGGIITSSVGFSFSLIWRYVTTVAISLLLGQLIFRLFNSKAEEHRWWPMLLGVVILVIVTAIPVLGWLVRLVTVLLGLGAIWIWGRDWLKKRKSPLITPGA